MLSDVHRAMEDGKQDILETGVAHFFRNRFRELGDLLDTRKEGQERCEGVPAERQCRGGVGGGGSSRQRESECKGPEAARPSHVGSSQES